MSNNVDKRQPTSTNVIQRRQTSTNVDKRQPTSTNVERHPAKERMIGDVNHHFLNKNCHQKKNNINQCRPTLKPMKKKNEKTHTFRPSPKLG